MSKRPQTSNLCKVMALFAFISFLLYPLWCCYCQIGYNCRILFCIILCIGSLTNSLSPFYSFVAKRLNLQSIYMKKDKTTDYCCFSLALH